MNRFTPLLVRSPRRRSAADLPYTKLWSLVLLLCALTFGMTAASRASEIPSLQRILDLSGWDEEALAQFADDVPRDSAETARLLKLLQRLRTFDPISLEEWTERNVPWEAIASRPSDFRGRLLEIQGRVTSVSRHKLRGEEALRFELPAYYVCRVTIDESSMAVVLTAAVPSDWLATETIDEPVSLKGLFVKRQSISQQTLELTLVARRIAWHPVTVNEVNGSFGRAVLGSAGFDVGLFDLVRNRRQLHTDEREAFFQLLDVVGRLNSGQLIRWAQQDLANVAQRWRNDLHAGGDRQLLAAEVVHQSEQGRYSVAPLFNDPDHQVGNIVAFDGLARRVVRIEVTNSSPAKPDAVVRRWGFDHYFEVDVFTEDSQNHPVVFCVRELPAGFPVGDNLHETVRVAGFFLKSWLHHARKDAAAEGGRSQQQFAPLLIGPQLEWLREGQTTSPLPSIVGGGLFLLALAGIWVASWWLNNRDRDFHQRVIARQYAPPEGQSMDDVIGQLEAHSERNK